jgi:hypothetical protein
MMNESRKPNKANKAKARPWLTGIWTVLRFLLIPFLCVAAVAIGLYAGYSVIGDGQGADVWKLETWKHLIDLIFAD